MRAVGIDIASRSDWTAVAVLDVVAAPVPSEAGARQPKPDVVVRHLERWRGPYPEILQRIDGLFRRPALVGAPLILDSTGVGRAVADLLRDRVRNLQAVQFTSGFGATSDGADHRVPKADLVGALEVLVSTRRLKLAADLPLGPELLRELGDFGYRVNERGHTTYDGQGTTHDDLVAAVSLAAWWLSRQPSSSAAFLEHLRQRAHRDGVPVSTSARNWRETAAGLRSARSMEPPAFRPAPTDGPGAA